MDGKQFQVLGDSGCTSTCMSYDYFITQPHLKKFFKPTVSTGVAIDGAQVSSIGEVPIQFQLGDVPMSMTCKIIKGLMEPVVLGWNWICKYEVLLDSFAGKVRFCRGKSAPLVSTSKLCVYQAPEDIVLPPNSKV